MFEHEADVVVCAVSVLFMNKEPYFANQKVIKEKDENVKDDCDRFDSLLTGNWYGFISATASVSGQSTIQQTTVDFILRRRKDPGSGEQK